MLFISETSGHVDAERITVKIFSNIERRKMDAINGIVVHQTDSSTAQSTFNSYKNKGANGAHFLIDKDGTIYQTASLHRVTNHVGKLQSRCINTLKCSPVELKASRKADKLGSTPLTRHEAGKIFPNRYPKNADSIGIEIMGRAFPNEDKNINNGEPIYESVTNEQDNSLKWLIRELLETFKIKMQEVYRHSEIGRKNRSEASTAQWN